MRDHLSSNGRETICLVSAHARSLVNFRGPLIKEMLKRGYKVHAIAPGLLGSEFANTLEEWGVETHEIPLSRTGISPLEDLQSLCSLFRKFRSISPGKVLLYNIKPATYGLLAAWMAGVKGRYAMITGVGYAFTGKAQGKRLLVQAVARFLYKLSLSKAKLVFFQNPDDESLFRELKILKTSTPSVLVNGSGVDVNYFDCRPVPNGEVAFLMLARLLADKGVREYAEAAYQIKKEFPSVSFRLAGDFDDNPNAISTEEVDKWVRDGVIEYLGRIPDVRPAIEACTVYVLPSYREGTPRTVLEAMSIGRPVITTDAPGCRETVIDGMNGYLVPIASSTELAEKMKVMIECPDIVRKMALSARKIVIEKYDVRLVNDSVLKAMGVSK